MGLGSEISKVRVGGFQVIGEEQNHVAGKFLLGHWEDLFPFPNPVSGRWPKIVVAQTNRRPLGTTFCQVNSASCTSVEIVLF